jgi:LAO/AO transport system kinase
MNAKNAKTQLYLFPFSNGLLIIPFLIIIFESMKFSTEELIEGIRSGNKRLIAKAITLVESKKQSTGYRQKNF